MLDGFIKLIFSLDVSGVPLFSTCLTTPVIPEPTAPAAPTKLTAVNVPLPFPVILLVPPVFLTMRLSKVSFTVSWKVPSSTIIVFATASPPPVTVNLGTEPPS